MAILSSYDEYLALDYVPSEDKNDVDLERAERLSRFPYSVMLQLVFPEIDFVNRWCWKNLGASYGECLQSHSHYRVCEIEQPHCHYGNWTDKFLEKTDYDFGFNEWYFISESDQKAFLEFVPMITWGEKFPD